MYRSTRDLTGEQIGYLTVLRRDGDDWWCRCDCGSETPIPNKHLSRAKSGRKSCGCRRPTWVVEWTPELDRVIADEREAGLSTATIARGLSERLGLLVTKNMVLGRCYRRHLTMPKPKPKKIPAPRMRGPDPGCCCYPHGDPRDPDFNYCGTPVGGDRDYCPEHHALTHLRTPQTTNRTESTATT